MAYDSWLASLPGGAGRMLVWARADDSFCIGSPGRLSFGSAAGWTHVGWHEIERGGWNVETQTLSWVRHDGDRGSVALAEPGRLPELFRERVEASIMIKKYVPLVGDRGVTVTARRNLAGRGEITWHSTLTKGLSWQIDGVREAVDVVMAEVRTEYDFTGKGC